MSSVVSTDESPASDVLVIDDSDIARLSMVRALQASGMRVMDLPSPIGASRTIIRNKVKLVVIDINMPSMRGDKLAALFRSSDRLKHLKLVLVSGADLTQLRALAKEAGADDVVAKSAGNHTLVQTVRRLLGQP